MSNRIKREQAANVGGEAGSDVVIGWVHPGDVSNGFMDSVLRTVGYDLTTGGRRIAGWNSVQCSANVSSGRNALMEWFLESPAQWLMMIDTDMVWQADAVHRLLEAADPDTAPVVGGLCFSQEADTGRVWPTLFTLVEGETGGADFARFDSWPADTLFPVVGTGAAFLLIHRDAAAKVRDHGFSKVYPWFQERELSGKKVGEDVTFCMRLAQLKIPVSVHTGVLIGHIKRHIVTVDTYVEQMRALAAANAIQPTDTSEPAPSTVVFGDDDE